MDNTAELAQDGHQGEKQGQAAMSHHDARTFLRHIASIAEMIGSGVLDPSGIKWDTLAEQARAYADSVRAKETKGGVSSDPPQQKAPARPRAASKSGRRPAGRPKHRMPHLVDALKAWMSEHDMPALTDLAQWINERIGEQTGAPGNYDSSRISEWMSGRRDVPATVRELIWPDGVPQQAE